MFGHAIPQGTVDYLDVVDPETDTRWLFDVSFLMSNWSCIYGNGCVGIHDVDSPTYTREGGCCVRGCWIVDPDDLANVERNYALLTDEDWDVELRRVAEKKGWIHTIGKPKIDSDGNIDEVNVKSRVYQGMCIFSNRIGNSSGKIGCAFHALADRLGVSHVETKPEICWQLPLHVTENDDGDMTVSRWDRYAWGGIDDDGSQKWLNWWCIDSPDAYVGAEPVYKYLEKELRKTCGDKVYDLLVEELYKRKGNYVAPMAGSKINDGNPLIPLIVLNKKPIR